MPEKQDTQKPTSMAQVIRSIKGGQQRAGKLSPERRKEIAQAAAKKRWRR
jgi:hypothetical protein